MSFSAFCAAAQPGVPAPSKPDRESIERLLTAARDASETGEPARALALVEEALKAAREGYGPSDPVSLRALETRGVIAFAHGDTAAAERDLSELQRAAPKTFASLLESAQLLGAMNRHAAALEAATDALALSPGRSEALVARASALIGLGRLEESVGELRRALAARPGSAQALRRLADAYRALGRFDEAKKALDQAHASRDVQLDAVAGYARLYKRGFADAEPAFLRTIKENPNLPMPHHHYAAALEAAGRYDDALRENEEALRLHRLSGDVGEDYVHTLVGVAGIYRRLERLPDEERSLRLAEKAAEPGSSAWAQVVGALSELDARVGRLDSAEKRLRGALEACAGGGCGPTRRAQFLAELADALLARKEPAQARAFADSSRETLRAAAAGKIDKTQCDVQLHVAVALGRTYSALNEPLIAQEVFRAGLKTADCAPRHHETARLHVELAGLRLGQGDRPAAVEHFLAAKEIYASLGDAEQAQRAQSEADAAAAPKNR